MSDNPLSLPKGTLLALFDRLQDAIYVIENDHFVFVNQRLCELFGYPKDELFERSVLDFVHQDDRELVNRHYQARMQGGQVEEEYRFRIITKQGEIRLLNTRVGLVAGDHGGLMCIGSLHDLTEASNAKRDLAHSQADISSILNNLPDVFYRTDMQGIVTLMSPSSLDGIGYTPEQMIGRPLKDFYCNAADREKIVEALVKGNGRATQVEACLRHRDGSPVWVSTNAYIRLDEAMQPVCIEGIARNITERKALEEQLARLVKQDDLTDLLNRRSFLQEAEQHMEVARRYQRPLAMMMLDLDWFKTINDRYGHPVGDKTLVYFANACREVFRKVDIIGRMGGEEFAVLMPETDSSDAGEIVRRLRRRLKAAPLVNEDDTIQISFSAGLIAMQPEERCPEAMLKRADRLLYQAKENGRDQVVQG